ncbi:STM4015 family protein [Tissierellaceae bacterium HCP3S3_D8]
MITKKYTYDYDDYEDGNKDASTLIQEILDDPQLKTLEEIVIGCWGECYDNDVQIIIDTMVREKERFKHIRSLYIGDMTFEECEVSWIQQGDYSKLWEAFPQLESLIIKGSQGLILGNIVHNNLKNLEIICGGLPKIVINELAKAQLPSLERLNIYIGSDYYGFDGDITDIENLISHLTSFENLTYLGIGDSEIQDEIVEKVLENSIVSQLEILELSNGTLTDKGGKLILENKEKLMHLKKLDLHYHFLSDKMMNQLKNVGIEIDLDEQNENDEEYGNYAMLTE